MKYDVIVIGSGLSGLAAGIRLAMFDKKVLIIEKHTVVGGLNSYYTRKNRTIDVGLHAMTNYAPKGARILRWVNYLNNSGLAMTIFVFMSRKFQRFVFPTSVSASPTILIC